MHHAEFADPRLVEVYDAECVWGPDDDFFLSIVDESRTTSATGALEGIGARVLDLGCGTGRLTLALADAGHVVTGIDPAPASLEAARAKPGADLVRWILGTLTDHPADDLGGALALTDAEFDVAVMTSHVAQFFVSDDEWARTLAALARVIVPGGILTFDSRDPRARKWEDWNPVTSRRTVTLPSGQVATIHTKVTAVVDDVVSFTHHYSFDEAGVDVATSTAALRFRSEDELRSSLAGAGFTIDRIYGGPHREPVGAGTGELLVVARRVAERAAPTDLT